MIVTVLWEDSPAVETKAFGPHELLLWCAADDLREPQWQVRNRISSTARKGNGGVLAELRRNVDKLQKLGPVFAVVDCDEAHAIWKPAVAACKAAVRDRMRSEAPGAYELILLVDNMESLLDAVLEARGLTKLPRGRKPNPNERDAILRTIDGDPQKRAAVRTLAPSFDRLVRKVVEKLQPVV